MSGHPIIAFKREWMKVINTTAALAFLAAALVGSFSSGAYAVAKGAMKGVDPYNNSAGNTCSGAAQRRRTDEMLRFLTFRFGI
jgi:hypothetical protein